MTIKQHGGIFGRNPTFNNVSAESLTIAGNAVPDAGTILVDGDIGSTVQGYDADTAKYDDATANFTGTLQNGGSNVLVDTDIGSTVQGYDADTAKLDAAQTFTAAQTFNENIVMANTKGIDFSATGDGSGTTSNELFDDYEEGTWTPIYETDGNPFTSITYTSTSAIYTKIGNTVFITGFIRTNAITVGSASGQLKIGGLPFTSSDNSAIAISQVGGFAGEMPRVASTAGASMFLFFRTAADGGDSLLQASDAATGATANSVRFAGVYQA